MAKAEFSENGKYYSAITNDGRLRIWDTETNVLKQEYTPDLHLTAPPCCMQWISVAQSAPSQRRGQSTEETNCIALGTVNGKILIYSVSQAKVLTVLTDDSCKSITAIDWHKNYGLYCSSKDKNVYEWNLADSNVKNKYNCSTNSKVKITAIKLVPVKQSIKDRYLIVASYQCKLYKLSDGDAVVVKNFGHNESTTLLSIATVNDVCWLIEGSEKERLLSFWDVTITDDLIPQTNGDDSHKNKKRKSHNSSTLTTPTYSFVLEDAPKIIDVALRVEEGAVQLSLAAATRSGVVHYYSHMLNGTMNKPIKPSVTITIANGAAHPLPLQCCRLTPQGILMGYLNGLIMNFERITPDLKQKTQILIRGDIKEKKPKKGNNKDTQNSTPIVTETKQVTYVEPMGGVAVSRKRTAPGKQVEVPMEARLANLALDVNSKNKTAVSHNLTKLLMQGLHSKDHNIILTVLQKNDSMVAKRTVAGLSADYVPLLLQQLADLASKKTSQCASVCTWLNAVVKVHSALLLASMDSQCTEPLIKLLAIFTQRRSNLCQLLNLKGRIDLTMSQRVAATKVEEVQQPILEYNDTSSDDEIEAEQYQSDNASWSDEKFEDSDNKMDAQDSGEESDGD